uniref:Uncharacterized protein n=1 Tax=Solanum lycopersicum TaxID=4081 RepID=A0A3Q7F0W7_SOLLC
MLLITIEGCSVLFPAFFQINSSQIILSIDEIANM